MPTENKIDKEIDALATKMVKSTIDPKTSLFNTILELGPEGLKKAAVNLSPEETELLKASLDEMKKAANTPKPTDDAKKLAAEQTKTKATKMKQESESGSDDQDEKLMESKNADHKPQGGPADSPLEGQVIKGREPGQEHTTASGAVIIGHTSTGKPMYANAEHPAHKDMDHKDHKEAARMHQGHAESIRSQMISHERDEKGEPKDKAKHVEMYSQARLHEKNMMEHLRQGSKKEDAEMQKCYGGSMSKSTSKEIRKERKLAKSLFSSMKAIAHESKDMPEMTKQQCMNDIEWKIRCLKDLREQAWLVESEVPEVKEMMEKKFSKIKSEIRALCEKHGHLKKAYENFMTKAEDKKKEKLAKKQGVPEGVDPKKWERGVREVKAEGHDKTSAIKIVNSTMAKAVEQREDAKIDDMKTAPEEKKEVPSMEKLAKKEMKKAKKVRKSLQKIVKLAKALKMTREEVVKAIHDSKDNLKLVKAELKAKLVKAESMDAAPQNPEQNQVKQASQDKKQEGMDEKQEQINKDKAALEIKAPQTADQAVAAVAKVEKSVKWGFKNSIGAGTLGRNAHYNVDEYNEKADAERKEIVKKGGYWSDSQEEPLKKAEGAKADLNDLIEKGFDYSTDEIKRIEGLQSSKPDGIKLVKSFHDEDIARALNLSPEEYKKLMGE
jgi:hypothetical protein